MVSIRLRLQSPEDVVGDFLGGGLATHIRSEVLALLEITVNGSVNLCGGRLFVQELEHEGDTAKSGNGVGDAHSLNVGSGSVARLANGKVVSDVGRGNETKTAHESGGTVGQNVSVEVGGDNDIVRLGLTEQLVDHAVDNLLLDTDARKLVLGEGGARGRSEQAVRLREDVALVRDGDESVLAGCGARRLADLLPPQRNLASHGSDAERGALGDALDGLCDLAVGRVVRLLLLDVEILGVFAHNDEVNGVLEDGRVPDRLDGPDVGVQVHALAESDNRGRVALCGSRGRAHGSEEGAVALGLERLYGLVGEGGARLLEGLEAGIEVHKRELEVQRRGQSLEETTAGGNDLAADTIAGDETCCLSI